MAFHQLILGAKSRNTRIWPDITKIFIVIDNLVNYLTNGESFFFTILDFP